MNVGLPGTGIGGLFYLLLAVLMPVRELWMIARGRSSRSNWKAAALQSTTAVAILSALWGEGWLMQKAAGWASTLHGVQGVFVYFGSRRQVLPDNSQLIAIASFMTLAVVLLLVHGAGTFLGLRASRQAEAE